MDASVQTASAQREDLILGQVIDERVDLLLANYQRVTANPKTMAHLKGLLRHYAKDPHPWRACYADNLKRFGPDRTRAVCGVLKDTIRQSTGWRGHPGSDVGDPGVGIADADSAASKKLSTRPLAPELTAEMALVLDDLAQRCDVYRVLIGLDAPPISDMVLL